MRVFVTGATGFIGSKIVRELLDAKHQVLGLTRSDSGAKSLSAAGAKVHQGSLEDLESLRTGATNADAVIHTAFIHDFSNYKESCETDKRAIEAIGSVLTGSDRPLIVTSGLAGLAAPSQLATEDNDVSPDFPFPRVSEQTALSLKRVSASIIRLPQVHDTTKAGLVTFLIALAREKGVSAYVGEGRNSWSAAHVLDVAHLYRLALEKHQAGAKYHAVGEEGVAMGDIAEAIGKGLNVPVVCQSPEQAKAHFGLLGLFVGDDLRASSAQTRKKLGWNPTGPGLLADLAQHNYVTEDTLTSAR